MYLSLRARPEGALRDASPARRVAGAVVVLGLVSMVTDIATESVNAVLPVYLILVVGISPQAFGLVNGLYNGVSALVRIAAGWSADRSDRPKWVAFAGYLISAASKFGLLAAHAFGTFSAIAAVDQIGKGIRTAPRDGMIAASSSPATLSRSFGVHRALDTFGAFLGPLLAFGILATVPNDFHSVFVAASAFAAIGVATLVLLVPDLRPRRQARRERVISAAEPPGRVSMRLFADPRLGRLLGAAALLGLLSVGEVYVFLELQFRDSLALTYYPLLVVGMNLTFLALAVPVGRLADRVGRRRVFLGGHVALVIAYLAAGGPLHGPVSTVGCLIMLGAFYAATDGVLPAMASRATHLDVRTSAIATAQTVVAATAFFSSLGFATLWATIGRADALLVVAALLTCALPAAALLLRGAETRVPVGRAADVS